MVEFSSLVLRVFIVTKVKEIIEASASVGHFGKLSRQVPRLAILQLVSLIGIVFSLCLIDSQYMSRNCYGA